MSEKYIEYLKSVGDLDWKRQTTKRRGYFMMNNNVVQCLCLAKLNGTEYSIMLNCILRTHGEMNYDKKSGTYLHVDIKSQRRTADKLCIDVGTYNKGIKSLIRKNMLKTIEDLPDILEVNLEFTEWESKHVKAFILNWIESDKARLEEVRMKIQKKKDKAAAVLAKQTAPVALVSANKEVPVTQTEHVIKSVDEQSDKELLAEMEAI